jgi:CRP-like cAMP-binding protein
VRKSLVEMWYLDNINLYDILCPPKIKGFVDKHFIQHNKNDIIYYPGTPDKKVYLISKGKVKVVHYSEEGNEIITAILTKGELFGEEALWGEQSRDEEAIAMTDDTQLCPLSVDKMYELMRDNGRFSLEISKIIGFRLKKMERRLERLLFKDARTRLIEFIRDLIEEQDETTEGKIEIKHFYTQSDNANLIGTTRETVTKLLIQFKQDGILEYTRKLIVIPEKENFLKLSPS